MTEIDQDQVEEMEEVEMRDEAEEVEVTTLAANSEKLDIASLEIDVDTHMMLVEDEAKVEVEVTMEEVEEVDLVILDNKISYQTLLLDSQLIYTSTTINSKCLIVEKSICTISSGICNQPKDTK